MAQVKLLKIGLEGFHQEMDTAADDITLNSIVAGTSLSVTGGVSIGTNITFTNTADTIAGIENQNLLDKTAGETITGIYDFTTGDVLVADTPQSGQSAVSKTYVDAISGGVAWQEPILAQIDFTTSEPVGPTVGDRYINTTNGTSSSSSQTVIANAIYDWNGTDWTEEAPTEGWAVWDEQTDMYLTFNGTTWVQFGTVFTHNSLSGLQGGQASQYYHLSSTQHTVYTTNALTADRITQTDSSGNVSSLSDLTSFVAGTVNQVSVADDGDGSITLSTPQDIASTSDVTFNSVDLTSSLTLNGSTAITSVVAGTTNNDKIVTQGYIDDVIGGASSSLDIDYDAGEAIVLNDAVYISGADAVSKANAGAFATARVIGFANAATASGASITGGVRRKGIVAGVLAGATAGTPYFLQTVDGTVGTARPSTSGSVVYLVGYAKNATDLDIEFQFNGVRS